MTTLATIRNPFGRPVVADAWDVRSIDVPEINARAFATCMQAFARVAGGQGSESIILHGAAGSGKTHLLGRLQHHLVTEGAKSAADGALKCVFVAVKLQTSPQMLWQHLRRRFADDLLRETEGASQLQRLVAHYLAARGQEKDAKAWVRKIRVLSQIEDETVESLLEEVSEKARLGFELRRVLSHLIYRRNMSEARGWLRGDPLPEEALARLGLSTSSEGEAEDQAREVIVSLCRLAEDSLPIVFCFDQIEALQSSTTDGAGFLRLGQQLAELFESDNNILIVTCLQSFALDLFKDSVREANWQRISRRQAVLDPLDRKLAELLLERRLESDPTLAEIRRSRATERVWPLVSSDLDALFEGGPRPTARRLLLRAEQIFFERATGRAAPPSVPFEIFLEGEVDRRLDHVLKAQKPEETEGNLRHGLPLVVNALEMPWRSAQLEERDVQLEFESDEAKRIQLSVCNAKNMKSLAATLRRLVKREAKGQHVIVRDPRFPVSKTAKRCREYLGELEKKGVRLVEPDIESLALLDAVRTVLSDARAGDLMHDGLPLPVESVEKWLRETLDERLTPLVEDLLAMGSAPVLPVDTDRVQDLAVLLSERLIISLEEAAGLLDYPPDELERVARGHPARFGVLNGPPAVLFLSIPPSLTGDLEEEVA